MTVLDMTAKDRKSNTTRIQKKFFKDNTPPTVRILLNGEEISEESFWVKDGDIITIEARDDESGVALIAYRIDESEWQEVKFPHPNIARVEIKIGQLYEDSVYHEKSFKRQGYTFRSR